MVGFASALGGNLGAFTCSIYRIEPISGMPIEPLPDILPGITPLRVTFDMVDGETISYEYDVTEHAVQGFLDVTTNVHKRLERLTVTGTLAATLQIPAEIPLLAPPAPGDFVRLDLMRIKNLVAMADARMPVMVLTPRARLARAFITNVTSQWGPENGESMIVSCSFKEARLVSPLTGDLLSPDFPAQEGGNDAATGGGQSTTTPVQEEAAPSDIDGLPPDVITGAG